MRLGEIVPRLLRSPPSIPLELTLIEIWLVSMLSGQLLPIFKLTSSDEVRGKQQTHALNWKQFSVSRMLEPTQIRRRLVLFSPVSPVVKASQLIPSARNLMFYHDWNLFDSTLVRRHHPVPPIM